jgi:hypothetical protein
VVLVAVVLVVLLEVQRVLEEQQHLDKALLVEMELLPLLSVVVEVVAQVR